MSADFKIKAIETHYNNYRFRSRSEARHAVLMDALGVKYLYEHEGYDIEGVRYLPDFWLPDYNCFIEIKGQKPTEDELHKINLLALYTGKDAHLFHGEIASSENSNTISYRPPRLWKYLSSEILGEQSTHKAPIAHDLLVLRQKMNECGLSLEINEESGDIVLCPDSGNRYSSANIAEYIQIIQEQQAILPLLQNVFLTRREEILMMLTPGEGWEYEFFEVSEMEGVHWTECSNCGTVALHFVDQLTHQCNATQEGLMLPDTSRLLNAYKSARQARFEFGR